jgi:hypothetical protein|uniref:Uncharacterized protein n=1 Tax=candidate division WOR-3 bacterium TaxID=2052148 RepID=A0A7V3NTW7_UNCW3
MKKGVYEPRFENMELYHLYRAWDSSLRKGRRSRRRLTLKEGTSSQRKWTWSSSIPPPSTWRERLRGS